jgi:hypothetical protein
MYEAIRDQFVSQGKSLKDAKTAAAKIYIAKSKSKKGRSDRAKALQSGV